MNVIFTMADVAEEEVQELSQEELLAQSQKRERKDLQAKIQNLKHTIAKGDKKKKKEVISEIALLEASLDQKHQEERDRLEQAAKDSTPMVLTENGSREDSKVLQTRDRISKAQRRREKKEERERERQKMIKEDAQLQLTGVRNVEFKVISAILKDLGLMVYEVPANGDCMFNAVSHQLRLRGTEVSVEELRKRTADYMRSHPDDFRPFLVSKESPAEHIMTEEDFLSYCQEMASTPAWGGEAELKALSQVLQLPISIVQGNGPTIEIGQHQSPPPLTLCFHRHAYRLGEHYNSVVAYHEAEDDLLL